MDSLYIVMPSYNEEANITEVINSWYSVLDGKDASSRLVVADSGSTDSTYKIFLKLQHEFPQLEILSDTGKEHGPKVMALYDYAIKKGTAYIFQTDSDGQTNADEFGEFWNLRGQFDEVFGKRTAREDGKVRVFVEYVVCILLRLYFGINVPDANAPFRLMKTDILKKYLYKMPSDYNLPNIMMTTYFVYYKEKVAFRTISFKLRRGQFN